jgi:hypothetical protein
MTTAVSTTVALTGRSSSAGAALLICLRLELHCGRAQLMPHPLDDDHTQRRVKEMARQLSYLPVRCSSLPLLIEDDKAIPCAGSGPLHRLPIMKGRSAKREKKRREREAVG